MKNQRLSARISSVCLLVSALSCPALASNRNDDVELEAAIEGPAPPEAPEVISRDTEGRVTLRAVRISTPIDVDGRIEENVYSTVPSMGGFLQQEPLEGKPATQRTDAWVLFDDKNVYVSARLWDSHPDRIVANELRRDSRNIINNDNFAVIFDTFYDRRNGFLFHTNPLGAIYDAQVTDERNVNSDWNTVWQVKSTRFKEGWSVEMAIPFKSLRYKQGSSQIWGVNFRRIVRATNEWSYLTPVPQSYGRRGLIQVSGAATMVGIEPPSHSMNLEIKPYAAAGMRTDLDADVPLSNDFDPGIGVDGKYGVTKSLTADFTVNTDFAQVEADDEQVNLTRFSLFLPEKREFFLEGQGIFAFGGANTQRFGGPQDVPIMFFSRRIGIEEVDDVDLETPIRVGARLTGRSGKYTIGLLNIQTGSEALNLTQPNNFAVVRVKRDILRRSNIGVIATHRTNSVESLEGSNSLYGVDANFTFIENLRINSYYARTSTSGFVGKDDSYRARINYDGDRYGASLGQLVVGEDFNPEVGFVRRHDIRKTSGSLRFSPRPTSIESVRKFKFDFRTDYYEDGLRRVSTKRSQIEFETEFQSGDNLSFEVSKDFEGLFEPFEITDGTFIPVGNYDFTRVRASYRMGPQRRVSGWMNASTGGFYGGSRTEVGFWGRIELTPQFSIAPNFSQNWVDIPEGPFNTTLFRMRATYAFSARAFVGALFQYNTSNATLSTNVRLRWEYQPGSDLFVVYSDGRDTEAISDRFYPELRNQSLIVKFTRLFRF